MRRGNVKVLHLFAVVAMVVLALLPGIVLAHVGPECRFFGPVTIGDQNVPDGTVVTAWLEDPYVGPCPATLYMQHGVSYYWVDVPGDEADEGETVYFSVNYGGNVIAAASGTFEKIGTVYHPLRLPGCIPGDANGDGVVDTGDITKVKRIIMGLDPPTPCADANQDGFIDTGDITKIKRIIMGLD
ncbi:MAG: dockerin type I repeat-containing protein [Dehalococcoidia bacterium]